MNLLEIIPTLKTGGAEKFVVELSNELVKRPSVNVSILQLSPITEHDICAKVLNNNIHRTSLNKRSGFSLKAMLDVWRYIKNNNITHVHAHTSTISYILLPALLCKKVKFVATIHNDAQVDAGNNRLIASIRRFLFKTGLCVPVTISEESNKSFKDFYDMDAPLVVNGVSAKTASNTISPFKEQGLHFVHIARVNVQKNQTVLYKAFRKLAENGVKVYLYHYGRFDDSALSQTLRSLCNENIKIMGESSDVPNVLRYADAMCLSSIIEGMPISIIESFSVGTPVICTPVGGCINMIQNGENGLLAKDISVEEVYNVMKRFTELPSETIAKMRQKALQSFEMYNIRHTADKYMEIFEVAKT